MWQHWIALGVNMLESYICSLCSSHTPIRMNFLVSCGHLACSSPSNNISPTTAGIYSAREWFERRAPIVDPRDDYGFAVTGSAAMMESWRSVRWPNHVLHIFDLMLCMCPCRGWLILDASNRYNVIDGSSLLSSMVGWSYQCTA